MSEWHADDRATMVCLYVCMQAIKYMARHIKHGDQTCERDLCVLFSGIHKKIICGCK